MLFLNMFKGTVIKMHVRSSYAFGYAYALCVGYANGTISLIIQQMPAHITSYKMHSLTELLWCPPFHAICNQSLCRIWLPKAE